MPSASEPFVMCLCKILAHFYVELSGLFLFFSMMIYKHEVQPFVGCHVTLWAMSQGVAFRVGPAISTYK